MRSLVTLTILALVFTGCAQNVETPQTTGNQQKVVTPTTTDSEQQTQGSEVINNFYFGTAGPKSLGEALMANGLPYKVTTTRPGEESQANTGWAFQNNAFTFTITTGGTTPSQTGTATGTGTGTQTASPNQTVYPVQDVKPRVGVAANLGVAPGGIVDQQATGSASEGDTEGQKSSEGQTVTTTTIKAMQDKIESMQKLIESLRKTPDTSPAPDTAPAE